MYRIKAPADDTALPKTFAYHAEQRGHDASTPALFQLLTPLLIGALVAAVGLPAIAVPVFFVAAIVLRIKRKRDRSRPTATLAIEGATLRVLGPTSKERLRVPLAEVLDVGLDTKTIEQVQEAPGPIPELVFVNATVGPPIDRSRIEIVTSRSGSLRLTEEHLSHGDALEWRGKMRQFLRKQGWVPESERQAAGTANTRAKAKRKATPEPS